MILLGCRETHLWYVIPSEVKSEALLNQYLDILSPCEKETVFQMRGEEPRKRALLARALVRTTIARCMFNILFYFQDIVFSCTYYDFKLEYEYLCTI